LGVVAREGSAHRPRGFAAEYTPKQIPFALNLPAIFLRSTAWDQAPEFVYALALGVYGSAAVPRVGLGPTPPPLCRYAVHTKRQGSG
jgi:hypothetical protein